MNAATDTADAPLAPGAATDEVRFVLDGRIMSVLDVPPALTVLDYLREHLGRCGTKEGCAEGDCGACTVVLGELDTDDHVRYRAINSCIRFLATIDGKELVTVESLADTDGNLHPVQQAMVDKHASQCGFCTPGFVMSLFALYLENAAPRREDVIECLAGNLCRCTGYRPIIDAGCSMGTYPEPARWSRADAALAARAALLRSIQRTDALHLSGFLAPRNVEELTTALGDAPQSLLLAGGTDVGLWVTKHLRDLAPMIYLGEVAELRQIESDEGFLLIGAAVSLTDAWRAIVEQHRELAELAQRFASPPVRNSGTLCGNIANGSPIGDAMPALIALGARIELRRGNGVRDMPLEDFYLGYQRTALEAGEFVAAVIVPGRDADVAVASYKWSKRIDQDISAVCAAFAVRIDDGRVASVRIAYGGMAAVPARARHAEAILVGLPWSRDTIEAAVAALARDFTPISDMRASADYRMRAAAQMLRRFFLERSASPPLLRTTQVQVA
ncbi:MAG TPA: xanthine dehydrogenase small subunit [Rudaea sp.]|jgi:xanthine dehydrogenase small subunit